MRRRGCRSRRPDGPLTLHTEAGVQERGLSRTVADSPVAVTARPSGDASAEAAAPVAGIGYGVASPGALVTPVADGDFIDSGTRRIGTGIGDLDVELSGDRRDTPDAVPDYALRLRF